MPRALSAAISPRRQRKSSNHKAFVFWIDSGPNDDNFSWHKADLSNVEKGQRATFPQLSGMSALLPILLQKSKIERP
jgi:hypothetical protein